MLQLNNNTRYFLYNGAVDMRKGCYGLCGLVNNELCLDLYQGDVFVFLGKRKNTIKLLQWDVDGFLLFEKRLAKGCFEQPSKLNDNKIQLTAIELHHILKGIVLKHVVYKKRYIKPSA